MVFRDGGCRRRGSELAGMVSRYGQQLAACQTGFRTRADHAEKFQLAEPRLMTKLSIVQNVFGVRPSGMDGRRFDNFRFFSR